MTVDWSYYEAVEVCRSIEAICPAFGCHVALTGGLLYKTGRRKDADILFYRVRQVADIDVAGLFDALERIGIRRVSAADAWVVKALWAAPDGDKPIDFFFPEVDSGDYGPTEKESAEQVVDLGALL